MLVLREILDKSVRTAADLEQRLQLRAISIVPYLTTAAERRRKRWRLLVIALLALAVLGGLLAFVDWYYLPLDIAGAEAVEQAWTVRCEIGHDSA